VVSEDGFSLVECEPAEWFVVFHRESLRRWVNVLAWGRYKHVSAFGCVPWSGDWVFFDFLTGRSRFLAVPNEKADAFFAHYSKLGMIVKMPAPDPSDISVKMKPGLWCVTAVAHLLGLRTCALRPDALLRHCLANGGTIVVDDIDETQGRPGTESAGRTVADGSA